MKKAFTLIELLVVVLIIGILAAIALPMYEKAVERAKMAEAVINVRAIANAHQVYYLANGYYVGPSDINKLDVQLQGKTFSSFGGNRVQTKDFVYAPNGCGSSCTDPAGLGSFLGLATRINTQNEELYRIAILQEDPNRFVCHTLTKANDIQKKLCTALNSRGYL